MTVRSQQNASVHIPLDRIDSSFGGSLLVPQSITESLLLERLAELGGRVEWSTEVSDVAQDSAGVTATLRFPEGRVEAVESDWVIACDGIHSLVRSKAGILVDGDDIESQYLVCDVGLTSSTDPSEVVVYAGDGSILGLFPLGEGLYRAIGNLEDPAKKAVDEPEIRRLIETRTYGSFRVTSVKWSSPFWIHSKMARNLRHGRVFLAGDAAHVHSPAGGQGMNTGMQDIYNLAWKLALVVEGKAPESLLDSYEAERRPVIRSIVRGTETLTKMALSKSRIRRVLRIVIMRWLNRQPKVLDKIAARLTQLSLGYRSSPLLTSRKGVGTLRPGDLAPDVVWDDTRLYQRLGDQVHTLLVFPGVSLRAGAAEKVRELGERLQERFAGLVQVLFVDPRGSHRPDGLADPGSRLHRRYGLLGGGLALIRPDQHLSFVNQRWSVSGVEKAVETALGRPRR